jgi:hypothetical protein
MLGIVMRKENGNFVFKAEFDTFAKLNIWKKKFKSIDCIHPWYGF